MIRLGTRGSTLATAQAQLVADALDEAEIVPIATAGDRDKVAGRFDQIGDGRGVFTREIEWALLAGEVDAAVHSAKDLTGEMPAGLVVAALLERDDPRDAVCGPFASLDEIPDGTRVGTSSARRGALLGELRPGLRVVPLRGNVDTRLRKLDAGEADAIVLAAAGLRRLGLTERIAFLLDPEVFVPEAGQGAIAVQVREGEEGLVSALDHGPTRRAVEAEREFALSVGGGCSVPVAAYAWDGPDGLELRTWVAR
ncbi:MAG TPA: hydroxymethylbilane synthase [Gaiellales bacterium]|jgi:hydroxymethylbilane synthase|nr:hydroxymethylbilane synthase [Gaiellales bacterium]